VCATISCGDHKITLSENYLRILSQIGGKNQKIHPKRRRRRRRKRRRRSKLNRNAREECLMGKVLSMIINLYSLKPNKKLIYFLSDYENLRNISHIKYIVSVIYMFIYFSMQLFPLRRLLSITTL
jgi:hypothetical protein